MDDTAKGAFVQAIMFVNKVVSEVQTLGQYVPMLPEAVKQLFLPT
jgi:hypothetical protein